MGCGSSSAKPCSQVSTILDKKYPMWVMSIADFLELSQLPDDPAHLQLTTNGMLRQHESGFFTIFVSHRWSSWSHPDPSGEKLVILQRMLQNLMDGSLEVGRHRSHPSAWRKQLPGAYLWLDWFSVPQDSLLPNSPHMARERLLCMESIPAYVEACSLFLALVPSVVHEDSGEPCNLAGWLSRGWCRTELWCKMLSPGAEPPIAVFNHDHAECLESNLDLLPRDGEYSMDLDCAECSLSIRLALDTKLAFMRKELKDDRPIDMDHFRYLVSRYCELSDLPEKERPLSDFLADFAFESVEALRQPSGIGAVACAVLFGDQQILAEVVEAHGAPLDTPIRCPHFGISEMRPIHLASSRKGGEALLTKLLQLRANPDAAIGDYAAPLASCRSPAAVEVLVQHRADVNGKSGNGLSPLVAMCGRGAPGKALGKLLELKASLEPFKVDSWHRSFGVTPLAYLSMFYSQNPWGAESLQVLLASRADIDEHCTISACRNKQWPAATCSPKKVVRPSALELLGGLGTTPLGVACHFGHEDLVKELLQKEADPDIKNHDGQGALQLARHQGVKDLLQPPDQEAPLRTLRLSRYDYRQADVAVSIMWHFNDELVELHF